MSIDLTPQFLKERFSESEDLKTNFKINYNRFQPKNYYKHYSEDYISFALYPSPYGDIIIGSVSDGICYLHFVENPKQAIENFKHFFFDCNLRDEKTDQQQIALRIVTENQWPEMVKIYAKGTDFQYEVWRALTKIKFGQITTYSELAKIMGVKSASRAVGSAIGANEIAYLIPCHRVVQKTGKLSGFRWGEALKAEILKHELSL
ncbi:methylated-DNA--[protein]-cysteine S-methyltransferase [Faecalibacter sp. LW9]|uniref:methylated-DNA--[protein]-cysteine S-methyltransferase n=1 Tax=Faecalibacter sp. LW9 TaxID=3103144 RepID=UPI002AFFD5A4|nr:methylated-DNA--[protein]-cysteine S-methyltransferase [Faecalibacter sp. LW9]